MFYLSQKNLLKEVGNQFNKLAYFKTVTLKLLTAQYHYYKIGAKVTNLKKHIKNSFILSC